jgi:hypothetical protein
LANSYSGIHNSKLICSAGDGNCGPISRIVSFLSGTGGSVAGKFDLFTQRGGSGEITREKVRGATVHRAGSKFQHD